MEIPFIVEFGITIAILLWVLSDVRQQRDYYRDLLVKFLPQPPVVEKQPASERTYGAKLD